MAVGDNNCHVLLLLHDHGAADYRGMTDNRIAV